MYSVLAEDPISAGATLVQVWREPGERCEGVGCEEVGAQVQRAGRAPYLSMRDAPDSVRRTRGKVSTRKV